MGALAIRFSVAAAIIALLAQAALADSQSVRFRNISSNEGLSQSFVYAITQDAEGFMWFGTQEGLNRYDGFDFTVFTNDPDDPASLSDESIRTVLRDSTGTLWVGTDAGGLSRFDSARGTFKNYLHDPADPGSIADNRIRALYEDSTGALWVGTDGSGLMRFDRVAESFIQFANDPGNLASLVGNQVWSILEDRSGGLWVGTTSGLSRLDLATGDFQHFVHDPNEPSSLGDNHVRVLFEDTQGNLWIGTEAGGLNRYDPERQAFERLRHDPNDTHSLSSNRINALLQDDSNQLWVATDAGLNAWNPLTREFDRYVNNPTDHHSLAHNNVTALYQDRGGVLWVGSYGGLSLWNPATRAMAHYHDHAGEGADNMTSSTVTSFAEDATGDVWVGTFGGGINILDRTAGAFRSLRHDPGDTNSLSSDQVMALLIDSEGMAWAGTRSAGLNRIDPRSGAVQRFRHDPEDDTTISANGVTYLLEDRSGTLWVGTFGGGLNYLDSATNRFQRFRHDPDNPNSLSNDRVLVLHEDTNGAIWIGTYGGGLVCFDPAGNKFERFQPDPEQPDSLSGDEIYMIQEDARGDLWIGAKGAGLNRWRKADRDAGVARFEHYGEADGLPSSTIYSGLWDETGRLWMSTARGLSRLAPDTLEFRNYDMSDGLQGDEFNLAAGFRAANGELFFGGMDGFNAFQPAALGGSRAPPPVTITQFTVFNEPVAVTDYRLTGEPVRLQHDQSLIGFEFAALDYAAPESNRFMYQLEGVDPEFVDAGNHRHATYSNLAPGNYTFRVRAANNEGVWSSADAALSIDVRPAPWQTWWAFALYAALVMAVLYAISRFHAIKAARDAERKHAEELEVVQARLNEAQRIASLGNWVWNVETNELWWSDEVYRLFRQDPVTFGATYETYLQFVHPEDRELVEETLQGILKGQERFAIDNRIILSDGTERIVHVRAETGFDDNGQPIRLAGTVHDITDRRAAEDEVRRRADYQALLAELSSEMIRAEPHAIDQPVEAWLRRIGDRYSLDAICIIWFLDHGESTEASHCWTRIEGDRCAAGLSPAEIPWCTERLRVGDPVLIANVARLPEAASTDKRSLRHLGLRSMVMFPSRFDDSLEGYVSFSIKRQKRNWTPAEVAELRLLADSLVGAVARSQAVAELNELRDQLQQENLYLREEVKLAHGFGEIIGEDPNLKRCLESVEKVAPTDVPVLVLGETGTGKELIARAIHKLSSRSDKPIISVNCPALPATLIESELFGHEKGAFTGADARRQGRFEIANTGTIFLDEIGELPLDLQAKLLRVLQTGEFERLGGVETLQTDVRLIAATNRELQAEIERGAFRADLYYRISAFPITLPPLRDRRDDIPLLAEHFVHKHAEWLGKDITAISASMLRELMDYSWPGNIRELESVIERAMISLEGSTVLTLSGPIRWIEPEDDVEPMRTVHDISDLASMERSHIFKVLDRTGGKISGPEGAAALLGIPPSTLRSKMKRLGIERE